MNVKWSGSEVPQLVANELVDVVMKGVTVVKQDGDVLTVAYEIDTPAYQGNSRRTSMCTFSRAITVSRVGPPEWPPAAADVWADRDNLRWFAQDDGASDVTPPVMWMVPATGGRDAGKQAARLLAENGPMRLVYRDEVPF